MLGGSNDAIIDVVLCVNKAGSVKDTINPSNAIPPMGKDSISVPTKPYQLGTPLKLTSSQIGPLKVGRDLDGRGLSMKILKLHRVPVSICLPHNAGPII